MLAAGQFRRSTVEVIPVGWPRCTTCGRSMTSVPMSWREEERPDWTSRHVYRCERCLVEVVIRFTIQSTNLSAAKLRDHSEAPARGTGAGE